MPIIKTKMCTCWNNLSMLTCLSTRKSQIFTKKYHYSKAMTVSVPLSLIMLSINLTTKSHYRNLMNTLKKTEKQAKFKFLSMSKNWKESQIIFAKTLLTCSVSYKILNKNLHNNSKLQDLKAKDTASTKIQLIRMIWTTTIKAESTDKMRKVAWSKSQGLWVKEEARYQNKKNK